jgi:hypothetical protein
MAVHESKWYPIPNVAAIAVDVKPMAGIPKKSGCFLPLRCQPNKFSRNLDKWLLASRRRLDAQKRFDQYLNLQFRS